MSKNRLKVGMAQLLVEGKDAEQFFIWACEHYKFEHIQVQNFGGITELDNFLDTLKVLPNYTEIPAILIIRDAETDSNAAIHSIQTSLEKNEFIVPQRPYQFIEGTPSVEFAILPGIEDSNGNYCAGTLEDLCMLTINENPIWNKIDNFLTSVQSEHKLTHWHKSRLHAYLSVTNKFVGMKIGEATRAGAWNWEHQAMKKFKQAMSNINLAAIRQTNEN